MPSTADATMQVHDVDAGALISVIVATFNNEGTLQQCIDSVAGQTYPHKELIVIDGGSSDGTVEPLKANKEKIAYWVSEPDRGIYQAWNKALPKATANGFASSERTIISGT